MSAIESTTLQFLSNLAEHNDRDWFSQNKKFIRKSMLK